MNREPRYIIILHADGGIRLQALDSNGEPTLEQMQTYVDGDIETVPAKHGVLIVNRESKQYPLPYNENATELLRADVLDIVFGDAVLCRIDGERFGGFLLGRASQIVDSLRKAVPV